MDKEEQEDADVFEEARECFEGATGLQQHSIAPAAAAQQGGQPSFVKGPTTSVPTCGGRSWSGLATAGVSVTVLLLVLLAVFCGFSTARVSTSTATGHLSGPSAAVSGVHSLGFCPACWNSTTAGYAASVTSTAAAAAQASGYPVSDALGVCLAVWNATGASTTAAAAAAQVRASAAFTPLLPQCLGASSLEWTCGLPAEPSFMDTYVMQQQLQVAGDSSFVLLPSNSSHNTNSTNGSSLMLSALAQPSSSLDLTCRLPDTASFMHLVQQLQLIGDSSTLHLRSNSSSSDMQQQEEGVVQVEASSTQQAVPAPVVHNTPLRKPMEFTDKAAAMFVAWIVGAHMHVSVGAAVTYHNTSKCHHYADSCLTHLGPTLQPALQPAPAGSSCAAGVQVLVALAGHTHQEL